MKDRADLKLQVKKKSKIGSPGDLARVAAPKAAQVLYNTLRVGPRVILRSAFELLRANTITRILSAIVLISFDTVSLFRKGISLKQYVINLGLALLLMVGGTAGWVLGNDVIGAVLLENVVLGIAAGMTGAGIFGGLTAYAWERGIKLFIQDDTADMMDICNKVFAKMLEEYKLKEAEAVKLIEDIVITPNNIKEMYRQKDREAYARKIIEPYMNELKNIKF